MKLVFSPLVAGMSGRAADAVAAAWKGVPYVRKFVVPHNPKSTDQTTQRGYMARMAPLFRSLPDAVTEWLDALAVGLGKSGFNLMVAEDLKHLHEAEDLEIVPANSKCNALFSMADDGGIGSQIDVTWVAGVAVATHNVHGFTCPVDPNQVGKLEPDGWTYQSGEIELVSALAAGSYLCANSAKDYYVALLVANHAVLATATAIAGGIGLTCTSGA